MPLGGDHTNHPTRSDGEDTSARSSIQHANATENWGSAVFYAERSRYRNENHSTTMMDAIFVTCHSARDVLIV